MRIFFSGLLLAVLASTAHAQKSGRALADSLYHDMSGKADTVKVKYLVNISRIYQNISLDTAILYAREGLKLAESANFFKGRGLCNECLGQACQQKGDYPAALDYFFAALSCYEKAAWTVGYPYCYTHIATVFQYEEKYDDGLKYDRLALNLFEKYKDRWTAASVFGDIAILYWRKHMTDSALSYDFNSLRLFDSIGDQAQVSRTEGNISLVYEATGNYDKALEYDFRSLDIIRKTNTDRWGRGIRYGNIAGIYLKIAEDTLHPHAGQFIPVGRQAALYQARLYIDSAVAIDNVIAGLFEMQEDLRVKARVEELLGNYQGALENYRKYIVIRDSVFSTENKIKIEKAQARHELEMAMMTLEQKKNEKWFFIGGIGLLTIIGMLFMNRQRLRRKKLEAEKMTVELERDGAVKLLESFKQSAHEKSLILERAAAELAQLNGRAGSVPDDETIARLEHSVLLTDAQWEDFKLTFEKVHTGFFRRVQEKMPDLTPAEIRFVALSKLKLSPKEMAGMLGISPNSIRNYRHRLRRKLELSEDASIEEIADAI